MEELNTIINSPAGKKGIFHHFAPALALNIALENGLPIKRKLFDRIISNLKKVIENGYVRWNENYPYDYDDTIITRNIFSLLEKPVKNRLKLSFSKEGGVYTYIGGLKSKPNNKVDFLINLIVLNYLVNSKEDNQSKKKIIHFLKKNKAYFKKNIENLSEYYLSEGYFIYTLSKVDKLLDVDIEKLIDKKAKKIKNKTDIGFLILASPTPKKSLIEKYKKADKSSIQIFQHLRLKLKFSCEFIDFVVRRCAEAKIKGIIFDSNVAGIYNKIKDYLYDYNKSADSLISLLKKYNLEKEKLVELGVGTANLSILLLKRGYRILGVDISKDMLKIAKDKTKNYTGAEYLVKDIKSLNIKPTKVIYSHNFIDFFKEGIEIWGNNLKDSIKIFKSISESLQKDGFLFIHKKELKKEGKNYRLYNKSILEGNKLVNIYIYKDKKTIMRKKYEKTYISYLKFKELIEELGLKIFDENKSWIILRKKSSISKTY